MKKKYFMPSLFLKILKEEREKMSLKAISKKAKSSESTAENNLAILYQQGLVSRKWEFGMWFYFAAGKLESGKRWQKKNHEKFLKMLKKYRERNEVLSI